LIGAETGTGKTTFVNQVCKNVSSQGARVVRYSLEDRMEDAGKEELYHEMNRLMKAD
jgi:Flp pilus assembly CpaF family ATPase